MNILITGSNGFLGTYFRKFNTLKRHNFIFASTADSKETVKCNPLYSNIKKSLSNVTVEMIIHLAAVIPEMPDDATYKETFLPNIEMMNNIHDFAIRRNIKKFIYSSGFWHRNFYSMAKIAGEYFCSLMEKHGIETASLRISSPYGEYSKAKNVINIFVHNAINNQDIEIFGTGAREQNFIYAGDVINALELCVEKETRGAYNIVSAKNTSMLELAKLIIHLAKSGSKLIIDRRSDPKENQRPYYDFERAKKELSYYPQYTIEKGLERYIKWLLQDKKYEFKKN